jgi:hypothetical protein
MERLVEMEAQWAKMAARFHQDVREPAVATPTTEAR